MTRPSSQPSTSRPSLGDHPQRNSESARSIWPASQTEPRHWKTFTGDWSIRRNFSRSIKTIRGGQEWLGLESSYGGGGASSYKSPLLFQGGVRGGWFWRVDLPRPLLFQGG